MENCQHCSLFYLITFTWELALIIMNDYYEKWVDNDVSLDIMNHWISCNVYPQSRKLCSKTTQRSFSKI